MISKHTFYSIFIPSLFFLIFHLVHPLLNLKDIEYKCVYVNPSLCIAVEKNKDSVKTIDLDDYEIKLDNLKVNLVEGSAKKQEFAKDGVLLIDDYDRTIGQFISSGGYAIQYTTLNEVLHKLRLIGLCPTNNT